MDEKDAEIAALKRELAAQRSHIQNMTDTIDGHNVIWWGRRAEYYRYQLARLLVCVDGLTIERVDREAPK